MQKNITYKVLSNSLAFIAGFSIIFIFVIGSLGGAITGFLDQHYEIVNYVLGGIIIILGIHMLGIFKIKSLMMEKRFQLKGGGKLGLLGSMVVGMAFSFGWTPCIGPILAAILALAANSGSYWHSLILMTCYSLGLAIPFFIAALGVNQFMKWFQKFQRHFRKVEIVSGILVIGVGVLILLGKLTELNQLFSSLGDLSGEIEGGIVGDEVDVSGGMNPANMFIAFVGGLVSFLSPCVLPLVPMYLSYLSGVSIGELTGQSKPAEEKSE